MAMSDCLLIKEADSVSPIAPQFSSAGLIDLAKVRNGNGPKELRHE